MLSLRKRLTEPMSCPTNWMMFKLLLTWRTKKSRKWWRKDRNLSLPWVKIKRILPLRVHRLKNFKKRKVLSHTSWLRFKNSSQRVIRPIITSRWLKNMLPSNTMKRSKSSKPNQIKRLRASRDNSMPSWDLLSKKRRAVRTRSKKRIASKLRFKTKSKRSRSFRAREIVSRNNWRKSRRKRMLWKQPTTRLFQNWPKSKQTTSIWPRNLRVVKNRWLREWKMRKRRLKS